MSGESPVGWCCKCCLKFILTSGLTALFVWLSVRTTKPSSSIKSFYLPALNTFDASNATRSNNTLYFTLNLNNKMKDKGVRYDDLHLTFYYGPSTTFPIANFTVPGFYQGHGKAADKAGNVSVHGLPWDAAFRSVSNGSKAVFRMDLATQVRYRIVFWNTKRHSFIVVNTTVEVNNSGKNFAPQRRRSFLTAAVFSLSLFLLILLL